MTAPYRVSVVIPTYRRCASVQRALQALAQQTLPADQYEVIVSIDGSEDGTREAVAAFSAPYELLALWQPNRGRATARNAGVRRARGELIILLDDDMEATPGFLAAHRQAHPPGSRQGVVGAVPIILGPAPPPIAEYIRSGFACRLERLAQPGYTIRFRDAYSGNFSIRRDILLEVGSFDEAFREYGHEDYELALRLLRAGVQLVYSPEALAYQHHEKDFAALARDSVSRGRNDVLFVQKHPEVFDTLKLSTYTHGSPKWRLLRGGLLALSNLFTRTPDGVILFMTWLERRRPARLYSYYDRAFDYFYWLGARSPQRQGAEPGAARELSCRGTPARRRPP